MSATSSPKPAQTTAFSLFQPTEDQVAPPSVGVQSFQALANKDGRKMSEGETWSQSIMEGTRTATMTRHRSGSITETHSDSSGGKHRAYHYSKTTGQVSRSPSKADMRSKLT